MICYFHTLPDWRFVCQFDCCSCCSWRLASALRFSQLYGALGQQRQQNALNYENSMKIVYCSVIEINFGVRNARLRNLEEKTLEANTQNTTIAVAITAIKAISMVSRQDLHVEILLIILQFKSSASFMPIVRFSCCIHCLRCVNWGRLA